MIKRLLALSTLGVLLSGCFFVPLALVGPAVSGFSTASVMQSALTSGANYMVKKRTGKTISQHAFSAYADSQQTFDTLTNDSLKQTYLPESSATSLIVVPQ